MLKMTDMNLAILMLCLLWAHVPLCDATFQYQRFDGYYNNLENPSWGGAGDEVIHIASPAYADLTYMPSGPDRPNPRELSNVVFDGPSGLRSYNNKTALFAFYGQLISAEVIRSSISSCPIELVKVPVPDTDPDFGRKKTSMSFLPFTRSLYNKETGQSPNRPRRPINSATAWIDAHFIYGGGEVWSGCLRQYRDGLLMFSEDDPSLPSNNYNRLPLDNYPNARTNRINRLDKMWMFGDPHSHQNPALASLAITWFRYHNYIAQQIQSQNPSWHDEDLFQKARRITIATFQNIIMYEWLPVLLDEDLPAYDGYNSNIRPSVSAVFESAAFRVGHSHIPPGIMTRDDQCNFGPSIRLCNSYFASQDLLATPEDVKNVLLGLTSQLAEREDQIIVDDLRGKCFGPAHFSRQDLAVITIMRGRDHGVPDYNTARRAFGLKEIKDWPDINPTMYYTDARFLKVIEKLRNMTSGDLSKLDIFPAGMLESVPAGMGELFRTVIKDQFTRLRDGDRFWFENTQNGILTPAEVDEIRKIKFRDVLMATLNVTTADLPENVFTRQAGDPCPQPSQLSSRNLEPCTPFHSFDYFSGSEVSFVTSFLCLGLVPFLCIFVAYVIAKCKQIQLTRTKASLLKERRDSQCCPTGTVHGSEWLGEKDIPRHMDIGFRRRECSLVLYVENKVSRVVPLEKMNVVPAWIACSGQKSTILIHIPKEYDLVLMFDFEQEKDEFLAQLSDMLKAFDKPLHLYECKLTYIEEKAITKVKRQELLTRFFRGVFAEAYNVKEIRPTDELHIKQCKEIVECELSRTEFAQALGLKPDALFVNLMFSIIDRDRNGYISFRELLYAVLLFSKGTCEDKMRLLFAMYDQDKSGTLNRSEVTEMVTSMMEMANTRLSSNEVNGLINKMFDSAGAERKTSLRFEDFANVFADQLDMVWDVCLDWKGAERIAGTKVCMPKKRKLFFSKSQEDPETVAQRRRMSDQHSGRQTPSSTNVTLKRIKHYIENHRMHICYLIIFYSICILVYVERFYYYSVEQEHKGFRSLASHGVSVTRGAAAVMSFTFSLLLLTMCRNTITKLRETFLNLYIPFDSVVSFHKWVAYTALFFTVMHIIGYTFNFYHIATQPVEAFCIFDEIHLEYDFLPKIHWWLFGNLAGMTGILLVIVVCVIYIFATQTSRKYIFNAFWVTHKMIYILYILILLHGASRIIQDPMFWTYFIFPALLFTFDKMVTLARQKREITVVESELLPSDVTYLELKRPHNFEYKSGQWVRLAVHSLGKEEYHSFTLTSAPNEDTLSVHVRAVGPWTWNFRSILDPENLRDAPFPLAYIDGPYGAGQQDWYKFEVSVLVGGGIGVTPYASILKDFVFMSAVKNTFKIKCQKLYFIWVTATQKHFEWFIDILKTVEEHDRTDTVETHIFITQLFQEFDLRTTMLYICEEHFQKMAGKSMFTGLTATTHFGRPKFDEILQAVHTKHPKVRTVGVFSCGPPGVTRAVQKACHSGSGKSSKTTFLHHYENF